MQKHFNAYSSEYALFSYYVFVKTMQICIMNIQNSSG